MKKILKKKQHALSKMYLFLILAIISSIVVFIAVVVIGNDPTVENVRITGIAAFITLVLSVIGIYSSYTSYIEYTKVINTTLKMKRAQAEGKLLRFDIQEVEDIVNDNIFYSYYDFFVGNN